MATAVFLRLRDGRTIRFGHARDAAGAAKVKNDVENWVAAGITLSLANARGTIEDVSPSSIEIIELCSEPTPTLGTRTTTAL